MKRTIKATGIFKILPFLCVMVILFTSSCNKEFNDTLPKNYRNDTLGRSAGKKVLFIVLDGVSGAALRTLAPTYITQINTRATYTFDGLADDNLNVMTNAGGWTTMFTGVEYDKHKVTTEDFSGLDVAATPTIFSRVKSSISAARMVSVASTAIFNEKLAADATEKVLAANDEAVKTAVVNEIKTNNPNLVVAQFHSAEVAGAANGYSATTASYANAITAIDGYINEILTAMRARTGFVDENWLVVIASNKGGGVSGGSPGSNIYLDPSRNTYVAFYNPKFSSVKIDKPDDNSYPFVGVAPRFISTNTTTVNAALTNTAIGNFGTSGDYVIMFKVRNDASVNTFWPLFLAKVPTFGSLNGNGWAFSFSGTSFQIDYGNITTNRPDVSLIRNGLWHTVATRVTTINGIRTVTQFSDGVKRGTYNISTTLNLTNGGPIRIGTTANTSANYNTNFLLRDLAIYNVGMTDQEVIDNMKKEISLQTAFASNLVGWWPCNEGSGLILRDKSGNNNNFTLTSNATWAGFNELSPNIAGNITQSAYGAVPNGVDIPVLIYNWLNISIPSSWGLTGKLYSPTIILPTN